MDSMSSSLIEAHATKYRPHEIDLDQFGIKYEQGECLVNLCGQSSGLGICQGTVNIWYSVFH